MNDSIIDLSGYDMDNVPEVSYLPKGTEVEVRLISVTKKTDKNNTPYLNPYMEIIDHPEAETCDEISDYIPFPEKEESAKVNDKRRRKLNQFATAFGFSWSTQVNVVELRGSRGYIVTGYKEDEEYGPKNTVAKYVTGA